jgi:branched-chain amino acid transport system ATP-binding protein
MSMPIISVTDIHTYYGESYILQGVYLSANPGEVVTILGRNGVGKSTLAKTIIGFLPARRGAIYLTDQDVTAKSPEARSRAGIALVPQGRRTFRSLTVAETLDMASHLRRFDRDNLSWTVDEIYSVFPRLAERRDNRAGTLSGGEQQMLAVGRALVGNPRVVVLDEPTEGLSPLLVKELQEVLRMVKARGSTLLLIEQRLKFAMALADRVVVINKGTVVFESSPAELERAEHIKHRYLGV